GISLFGRLVNQEFPGRGRMDVLLFQSLNEQPRCRHIHRRRAGAIWRVADVDHSNAVVERNKAPFGDGSDGINIQRFCGAGEFAFDFYYVFHGQLRGWRSRVASRTSMASNREWIFAILPSRQISLMKSFTRRSTVSGDAW